MATMARGERPASFTHDIQRLTPYAPMSEFDYNASAELYVGAGRSGLRYRRFACAADAIRFAVEKLPAASLSSSRLEVEERADVPAHAVSLAAPRDRGRQRPAHRSP